MTEEKLKMLNEKAIEIKKMRNDLVTIAKLPEKSCAIGVEYLGGRYESICTLDMDLRMVLLQRLHERLSVLEHEFEAMQ